MNPDAQEATAGGSQRVQGQPGLYRETLLRERDRERRRGREGNTLGTGSVPGAMKPPRTSDREEKGMRSGPAACPDNLVPISGSGQEASYAGFTHTSHK